MSFSKLWGHTYREDQYLFTMSINQEVSHKFVKWSIYICEITILLQVLEWLCKGGCHEWQKEIMKSNAGGVCCFMIKNSLHYVYRILQNLIYISMCKSAMSHTHKKVVSRRNRLRGHPSLLPFTLTIISIVSTQNERLSFEFSSNCHLLTTLGWSGLYLCQRLAV